MSTIPQNEPGTDVTDQKPVKPATPDRPEEAPDREADGSERRGSGSD
jgi:hypothetical protein